MKRKKRRWFLLLVPVIFIAAFIGWRIFSGRAVKASANVLQQRTAVVRRGTLEVELSGSGSVKPAICADLKVSMNGFVEKINMAVGQMVKKGDILLTLEQDSNSDFTMKKLQNALKQKELAYQKELNKLQGLTVTAPISGQVSGLTLKEGDEVSTNTPILTITDKTVFSVKVQFPNTNMEDLKEQTQVQVHIPSLFATISGEILSTRQNGQDANAVVLIKNPGKLEEGTSVWCEVLNDSGSISSTEGKLEWYSQQIVKAEISGTIEKLSVAENQTVAAGMTIVTLYNEAIETDIENARLAVEEAKNNIEQNQINADQYVVEAPIDGYIVSVTSLLEGDPIKEGATVATLVNLEQMEFEISIDELDINKVQPGQEVAVSAEAVEGTQEKPMKGTVKAIALTGNTQNGVTNYPVTVTVPGREGLKVGMNVDGRIQVSKKENTLMVPLEALQKRGDTYMVWVKRDGASVPGEGAAIQGGMIPGTGNRPGNGQRTTQDFGNLTDEERQALRTRMQEQFGNGQQNAPAQGSEAPAGFNRSGTTGQTGNRTSDIRRNQNANTAAAINDYYAGAMLVPVETGIYNESYMEIVSGLSEGETVVLPQQTSNTSTSSSPGNMMGGFGMRLGGMGGSGSFSPQGGRP